MARDTMSDLIQRVRDMTNAGTAVYSTGSSTYFSDDHIQDILDRNRLDFRFQRMEAHPRYITGGSVEYFDYEVGYSDLERTDGGTAIFWIEDGVGTNVGTANYSVDYQRGLVTFGTNTNGTAYYATGRAYDVHGAAADLLERWASHEALSFDVGTAERRLARSQKYQMLTEQARNYRRQAWIVHTPVVRSDLNQEGQP